jgi:hypothetical protein
MQNAAVELDDATTASSARLFQARFPLADGRRALALDTPFGACTRRSASATERMIQIYLGLLFSGAVAV